MAEKEEELLDAAIDKVRTHEVGGPILKILLVGGSTIAAVVGGIAAVRSHWEDAKRAAKKTRSSR